MEKPCFSRDNNRHEASEEEKRRIQAAAYLLCVVFINEARFWKQSESRREYLEKWKRRINKRSWRNRTTWGIAETTDLATLIQSLRSQDILQQIVLTSLFPHIANVSLGDVKSAMCNARGSLLTSLDDDSLENLKRVSAVFRTHFLSRINSSTPAFRTIFPGSKARLFPLCNPLIRMGCISSYPTCLHPRPRCVDVRLRISMHSLRVTSTLHVAAVRLFAYTSVQTWCTYPRDARHGVARSRWARKDFRLPFFPSSGTSNDVTAVTSRW